MKLDFKTFEIASCTQMKSNWSLPWIIRRVQKLFWTWLTVTTTQLLLETAESPEEDSQLASGLSFVSQSFNSFLGRLRLKQVSPVDHT